MALPSGYAFVILSDAFKAGMPRTGVTSARLKTAAPGDGAVPRDLAGPALAPLPGRGGCRPGLVRRPQAPEDAARIEVMIWLFLEG